MQTKNERYPFVNRIKIPLAAQAAFWLIVLSLIPLLIVDAFMQKQVNETYLSARLSALNSQARLYFERAVNNPGNEQSATVSLGSVLTESTFFLVGVDGRYIAHSSPSKIGKPVLDDLGVETTAQLLSQTSITHVDENKGTLLVSYRRSVTDPVAVVRSDINTQVNLFRGFTNAFIYQLIFSILAIALVMGIIVYFMFRPVRQLAGFANQLGKKNFSAPLNISIFRGEFTLMAESLSGLSENIQTLIADLEQKVLDRTSELEHRAVQLKATADVGKAITSIRTLSELLQQTTNLINERFGYYHVGVFLMDERKEYAVLSASNSEGGRKMLEKGHKLKVGETGIVGYVTESLKARIALDVGRDAVYFDNPYLPKTRSEMALPLVASGQIFGALDVQSTEPQAFTDEDVATLQTLADQIAVAIQNVNLLGEAEKALESARQVYGEVSREAWRKMLRYQPRIGFLATGTSAVQTQSDTMEPGMASAFQTGNVVSGNDGLTISVPIKIRGESIGAIRLKKSEISEAWTQDEINLAASLSDQLSGALESARLYRESQQRAARESLVTDISTRIGATSRAEAIVRETVQELGQVIGNAKITFSLKNTPTESASSSEQ